MTYKVETIAPFRREAKRLIKRYPSLKKELEELGNQLSINPEQGIQLGNNCYKIRLSIESKGRGKSGGARVITHFYILDKTVFLLYIFDKSDRANVSDNEISAFLKMIV